MNPQNLKSELIETISETEIKKLFENAKTINYSKGEFLFQQGNQPEYLDLLLEGQLQLFKYDNNLNEATLAFFTPISLVAELPSLCNFPYPASARFASEGKVARMPIHQLREIIQHDFSMNHFLIQCLLDKVKTLNLTINRGLMMDTMERVAHFLYHMPEDFPELKHNQIASMLLIRAETFSRALKELRDAGIIESSRGQIQLLKREELKKYLTSN